MGEDFWRRCKIQEFKVAVNSNSRLFYQVSLVVLLE